jgi:hypothetical protein
MATNGRRKGATLYDFRDLDLMLKVEERADNNGWAPTSDLASSLGFDDDLRPLGIRLAWMSRYGMVENQRHGTASLWRLTDGGLRVIDARLRAAQSRSIEALPDESMVQVMANITSRFHHGSPMMAHMLRREFLFGTKPR